MAIIQISDFLATLMHRSLDPVKQPHIRISLIDVFLVVKGIGDFQPRLADHHNFFLLDEWGGLVLEFAIVMLPCDVMPLLIDFFGLEVGSLEIGLALDVPLFDAFDLLILRLKEFIGEQQVGQKENLLVLQQLILLNIVLNPIAILQLPLLGNGLSDLPCFLLGNLAQRSNQVPQFLLLCWSFLFLAHRIQYYGQDVAVQQNQNSGSSIGISHALIENLRTGLSIFFGEMVRLVRENLRNRLGDFAGEAFFGLLLLSRRKTTTFVSLYCMLANLQERKGCGSAALLILTDGTYVLAMSEETFSTESFRTRCDRQVVSHVSAFLLRFSFKNGRSYIFSHGALSPSSDFPCLLLQPHSLLMAKRGKSEKLDSESMVAVLSSFPCGKKSKESSTGLRVKSDRLLL